MLKVVGMIVDIIVKNPAITTLLVLVHRSSFTNRIEGVLCHIGGEPDFSSMMIGSMVVESDTFTGEEGHSTGGQMGHLEKEPGEF